MSISPYGSPTSPLSPTEELPRPRRQPLNPDIRRRLIFDNIADQENQPQQVATPAVIIARTAAQALDINTASPWTEKVPNARRVEEPTVFCYDTCPTPHQAYSPAYGHSALFVRVSALRQQLMHKLHTLVLAGYKHNRPLLWNLELNHQVEDHELSLGKFFQWLEVRPQLTSVHETMQELIDHVKARPFDQSTKKASREFLRGLSAERKAALTQALDIFQTRAAKKATTELFRMVDAYQTHSARRFEQLLTIHRRYALRLNEVLNRALHGEPRQRLQAARLNDAVNKTDAAHLDLLTDGVRSSLERHYKRTKALVVADKDAADASEPLFKRIAARDARAETYQGIMHYRQHMGKHLLAQDNASHAHRMLLPATYCDLSRRYQRMLVVPLEHNMGTALSERVCDRQAAHRIMGPSLFVAFYSGIFAKHLGVSVDYRNRFYPRYLGQITVKSVLGPDADERMANLLKTITRESTSVQEVTFAGRAIADRFALIEASETECLPAYHNRVDTLVERDTGPDYGMRLMQGVLQLVATRSEGLTFAQTYAAEATYLDRGRATIEKFLVTKSLPIEDAPIGATIDQVLNILAALDLYSGIENVRAQHSPDYDGATIPVGMTAPLAQIDALLLALTDRG